ncbi:hypothetical protein EIP86_000626 [Pleurotus ostreatoroseus]|nr:hypothetical protein EIP86_000626 [Pleurotus ostreatoroseus]
MVDPTVDVATLLEALVNPNLHILRIVYLRECFTSPSFDILRLKAPRLQKLQVKLAKLGGSSAGAAANRSLLSLIPNFSLLTTLLYIDTILPTTVIVHLGTLPHLKVLNAALGSGSTSTLAEQRTLFPKLRRLWLAAIDAADVADLLEAISSTSLESLYFVVKVQPKSTLFGRCLDLAARHPQLSQLNIHYSREVRVRTNLTLEYIVDSVALQPLLKLPHLTNLGLRDTPLQLNDDFIHSLATSASQLRELVLGTSVRQRTSGLTMEGLKPLALHCPKLYLLAMTFATPPARESTLKSKLNWVFDRHQQHAVTDGEEGRSTSLRFLDIGSSRIQDPEAVAAFVTRYFPNVQEISDLWDLFLSHKNIGKLNRLIRKWGQGGVQEYVKYHSRPLAEVLFSETAPLMN